MYLWHQYLICFGVKCLIILIDFVLVTCAVLHDSFIQGLASVGLPNTKRVTALVRTLLLIPVLFHLLLALMTVLSHTPIG